MSYQTERQAIEEYLKAGYSATPIGYDAQEFTPTADSILATINNGDMRQGTIGGAANRVDHIGVLQIQIFTASGAGSQAWRGYAQTLETLFAGKIIDSAGAIITTPSDAFIRFSPQDQYPYVAGVHVDMKFNIATLNIPFVRYETL